MLKTVKFWKEVRRIEGLENMPQTETDVSGEWCRHDLRSKRELMMDQLIKLITQTNATLMAKSKSDSVWFCCIYEGSNQGSVPCPTIATTKQQSSRAVCSSIPPLSSSGNSQNVVVPCSKPVQQLLRFGSHPEWCKNLACSVPCGKDFLTNLHIGWRNIFHLSWIYLLVGLVLKATVAKGIKLWSSSLCAIAGVSTVPSTLAVFRNMWSSSASLSGINSEPCTA